MQCIVVYSVVEQRAGVFAALPHFAHPPPAVQGRKHETVPLRLRVLAQDLWTATLLQGAFTHPAIHPEGSCGEEEVEQAAEVHHDLGTPQLGGPEDAVHKHDGHLQCMVPVCRVWWWWWGRVERVGEAGEIFGTPSKRATARAEAGEAPRTAPIQTHQPLLHHRRRFRRTSSMA